MWLNCWTVIVAKVILINLFLYVEFFFELHKLGLFKRKKMKKKMIKKEREKRK